MDCPNFQDFFRVQRDEALSRNGDLSLEVIERDGSDSNIMLAASAAGNDEVMRQVVEVETGLFLDTSEGPKLDRLVLDRYGLKRKPAAPARCTVRFTTTTANATAFLIPSGTLLSTSSGVQFMTTTATTFPAGSVGPVEVPVRSVLAGTTQAAKAGSIGSIVSKISGAPADLAVNNVQATAGQDDEERDEDLRDRARNFYTTVGKGTSKAVENAALAVPGVRKATCFDALDGSGRPARFSALVVTDAFTDTLVQTGSTAAYDAQSQQLGLTVFNALSDVRPLGTHIQVIVASVQLLNIQLALSFQASADPDAVAQAARAAIVRYVNSLRPGETFSTSNAQASLGAITGLIITGSEIVTPKVDTPTASPLQVYRTNLSLVTVASQTFNTPPAPFVFTGFTIMKF